MRLFVRELGGDGTPLVILHGLFGSSRNWASTGRKLARRFSVYAFDLRNHGDSPHTPSMAHVEMARDVLETVDGLGLDSFHLIGHSLGGKVAMRFACSWPARVRHLFVVDIAPRRYRVDPAPIEALLAVDLEGLTRRSEVEQRLARSIENARLRQFLLTNLERDGEGFRWQANLEVLRTTLTEFAGAPLGDTERFDGPADFLFGGRSRYLTPGDEELIAKHFPSAPITMFPTSGHNVHIDAQDDFVWTVLATTNP